MCCCCKRPYRILGQISQLILLKGHPKRKKNASNPLLMTTHPKRSVHHAYTHNVLSPSVPLLYLICQPTHPNPLSPPTIQTQRRHGCGSPILHAYRPLYRRYSIIRSIIISAHTSRFAKTLSKSRVAWEIGPTRPKRVAMLQSLVDPE